VGTWSQDLGGIEWRSAMILYRNLQNSHAIAAESFMRGSTDETVGLREFGGRLVYRFPLTRDYLFGDFILGYSWPREHIDDPRMGSAMIGLGMVMTFGEFPF
jgi:hypothetical protein